ncbi:MAG: hypothetical protein SGJ23_02920 [Alphaproteobacteria bacterium]|nr:hypothetical protein [Alphaproteobacteria bacterium]
MAAPTFELYKLLVEEVREARKARRELANVFTTINVAGVGLLGSLAGPSQARAILQDVAVGIATPASVAPLLFIVIALLLTCLVWRTSNAYYTRLLGAKYAILYSVETELGIDPIQREWRALGDRSLFKFFSFERLMPLLFAFGYVVFVAYQVSWVDAVRLFEQAVRPVLSLFGR